MANYATNLFLAKTKCKKDIERINDFFIENFCDCDMEMAEDYIQGEFYFKWTYPEGMIDRLIESLEMRNDIYIRVLSYNFEGGDEYAEFRIFSNGMWNIKR